MLALYRSRKSPPGTGRVSFSASCSFWRSTWACSIAVRASSNSGKPLAWSALWFALAMLFAAAAGRLARTRRGDAIHHRLPHRTVALDGQRLRHRAHLRLFPACPPQYQHRVLFWGILGALRHARRDDRRRRGAHPKFRLGALCLRRVPRSSPASKCSSSRIGACSRKKIPSCRCARKFFPVTADLDGQKFLTRLDGRFALTPLALVLLLVETTDLIFAVDSVPAVFAVTTQAVHRLHLERLCHPRPALAVFPARRRDRLFPLSENRPVRRARLCRRENAARPARPGRRNGFRSKFRPASRCWSWPRSF